jgi:hypothetical protein
MCEALRDRNLRHKQQQQQQQHTSDNCAAATVSSSSVLLVSHGGPTTGLYRALTGVKRAPPTGYCGLFCYVWTPAVAAATSDAKNDVQTPNNSTAHTGAADEGLKPKGASTADSPVTGTPDSSLSSSEPAAEEGRWECLLVGDHEHLSEVKEAAISGPNDMVEQEAV